MIVERGERSLPIIRASNGSALARELVEMGHRPKDLFLKCRRPYADMYTGAFRNHSVTDATSIVIEGEAERVLDLHLTLPENVVRPIAMVKDNRILGYVEGHIDGRTMHSHRKFVIDAIKLDESTDGAIGTFSAKIREEFVDLGRRLIDLLRQLHVHGLGHGDVHYKNVIVESGSWIWLVDPLAPMPWYHTSDRKRMIMERDLERIEKIESDIEKLLRSGRRC